MDGVLERGQLQRTQCRVIPQRAESMSFLQAGREKCSSRKLSSFSVRLVASSGVKRSMGKVRRSMSGDVLSALPVMKNCIRLGLVNILFVPRMRSCTVLMVV